jgi:hypothetical protein
MPKKKVFVTRNLEDCYQLYHSDQEKQKRKSKFFYRVNFVLPLIYAGCSWHVDTSDRIYDDFLRLLFLHAHREASALANEIPDAALARADPGVSRRSRSVTRRNEAWSASLVQERREAGQCLDKRTACVGSVLRHYWGIENHVILAPSLWKQVSVTSTTSTGTIKHRFPHPPSKTNTH